MRAAFGDLLGDDPSTHLHLEFMSTYQATPHTERTKTQRIMYCRLWYELMRHMREHPDRFQKLFTPLKFTLEFMDPELVISTDSYAMEYISQLYRLSSLFLEQVISELQQQQQPGKTRYTSQISNETANEWMQTIYLLLDLVSRTNRDITPIHVICLKYLREIVQDLELHEMLLSVLRHWLTARFHLQKHNPPIDYTSVAKAVDHLQQVVRVLLPTLQSRLQSASSEHKCHQSDRHGCFVCTMTQLFSGDWLRSIDAELKHTYGWWCELQGKALHAVAFFNNARHLGYQLDANVQSIVTKNLDAYGTKLPSIESFKGCGTVMLSPNSKMAPLFKFYKDTS